MYRVLLFLIFFMSVSCGPKFEDFIKDTPQDESSDHQTPTGELINGYLVRTHLYNNIEPEFYYTDKSEITYCIEVAPTFSVKPEVVLAHLQESFSKWKTYLNERKINEKLKKKAERHNISFSPIPTNFVFLESCSGNEDVIFAFGLTNTLVNLNFKNIKDPKSSLGVDVSILLHRISPPLAPQTIVFINAETPDQSTCNWCRINRLQGILTHQIGHLFGLPDIPNTIMANYAWLALFQSFSGSDDPYQFDKVLNLIDWDHRIVPTDLITDNQEYKGIIDYYCDPITGKTNYHNSKEAEFVFKELTGVDPQGQIKAKIKGGVFTLTARQSDYEFELIKDDTKQIKLPFDKKTLFLQKAWSLENSSNQQALLYLDHEMTILNAKLRSQDESEWDVILYQNVDRCSGPVSAEIIIDKKFYKLFHSKTKREF